MAPFAITAKHGTQARCTSRVGEGCWLHSRGDAVGAVIVLDVIVVILLIDVVGSSCRSSVRSSCRQNSASVPTSLRRLGEQPHRHFDPIVLSRHLERSLALAVASQHVGSSGKQQLAALDALARVQRSVAILVAHINAAPSRGLGGEECAQSVGVAVGCRSVPASRRITTATLGTNCIRQVRSARSSQQGTGGAG